jgi:translation elongation factor EF-Tu-like GTPase
MREFPKVEAEMMFLTEAEGGRQQPPVFTQPMMYRPHVVVGDGEYLGTIFLSTPESVQPACPFVATFGLLYHPQIDYSALVPGVKFSVREGARVVGRGRVIKRWSDHVA